VHDRFGAFAGAESNIFATAQELKQRGWTVGLLHGPATGKGQPAWNGVFEERFCLKGRQSVEAAVQAFRPDAVYIHNLTDLGALEALLDSDLPLIRMVHDHNLYCMRGYKYNYFTRKICGRPASPYCVFPCGGFLARDPGHPRLLKWVSYGAKQRELALNRRIHRLIVATRFMKQELVRNGFDPGRIEIHPPVPTDEVVTSQSSFSDRNLIIYAGQITRGKGVDVLIESLARIRTPFECLIFGDGNYREHCERLCHRLGLDNRVHFQGYVPSGEIAAYYRECTVLAMSSVWPEPFGAAGLEGMRYGLPVVAFDAGGIKEWLTDGFNGFLVPWMDRQSYAVRLEQLLQNKALARRLGESARQSVASHFSFSKYVDGLESLFARVVAQPGPETRTSLLRPFPENA
jgi:glycosyltransferase involved in cell wall biosynthesis